MKLKNKKTIQYKGEVVDLSVSNSHTYNVENIAVHNSGGGSLVNYVLHITDMDPIRWELPFERFMSTYRVGIPDIDTDVSDRDKVLDVMRKQFGNENVVPISNYNLTKVKSLLKDLSKFYGIPFEEANRATATVEQEVRKATAEHGSDKNLFVLTFDDAMSFHCAKKNQTGAKKICSGCTEKCDKPVSSSFRAFIEKYPEVGDSMKILFKQNRSLGRHAGGVLVCDDLPKQMPLILSKGEPQSPWVEGVSHKHLEKIATFVKFDILGLETLRLIETTISNILKTTGLVDVNIDGTHHRLLKTQKIKLTNGVMKLVGELTMEDDVELPLQVL